MTVGYPHEALLLHVGHAFINITCPALALISVASPAFQEVTGMSAMRAAAMVGLMGLFNGGSRIGWASFPTSSDAVTFMAFFVAGSSPSWPCPRSPTLLSSSA